MAIRRSQAVRDRTAPPILIRGAKRATADTLRRVRTQHGWTAGRMLDQLVALYLATDRAHRATASSEARERLRDLGFLL